MGLARLVGDWWWLLAAPVFVGLVALFAFGSPYLELDAPRSTIRSSQRRVAHARADAPTLGHVPVRRPGRLGTSLPNAETEGIGPSRRVVLWDTLLDGRFTPRRGARS